jgi:phospholipid/cholesterol/gamma-HCH transport system substrate-binding protein
LEAGRNELKVGLAVFISLVILVGGIMWGKGYSIRAARYNIEVFFDNVGGLESGANVLANGVVQGRVTSVALRQGRVIVRAAVDKRVIMYSDYRITIESPTVMAGKALSLYPGNQPPLADISKPLKGATPFGMGEAVAVFEKVSSDFQTALHNLNALVVNLNVIVGDTSNQQNLSGLLANANGVARTSNEWLGENRDRLSLAVVKMDSTLAAAQQLVRALDKRVGGTLSNVDSAAVQIAALSSAARELIGQMSNEQGTLGRLMHDDELYKRLNQTLGELDSLSQSLRTKGLKHRITFF